MIGSADAEPAPVAAAAKRRWPRARYAACGLPARCGGCGAWVRLPVVQPFVWCDPDTGYPHVCES